MNRIISIVTPTQKQPFVLACRQVDPLVRLEQSGLNSRALAQLDLPNPETACDSIRTDDPYAEIDLPGVSPTSHYIQRSESLARCASVERTQIARARTRPAAADRDARSLPQHSPH